MPERHLCISEVAVLQKFLPSSWVFVWRIQTCLQWHAIVISWLLNQQVVLHHLFCHKVWQEALVLIQANLLIVDLFPSHLLKPQDDACDGVVVGCCKDLLAVEASGFFNAGFTNLPRIVFSIPAPCKKGQSNAHPCPRPCRREGTSPPC